MRPKNGLPIAPVSIARFTAWIGDCQRKFSCTISGTPACAQAATIALASSSVGANGFWQIAGTRLAAASSTSGRWLGTVVAMSTKSSCSLAKHLGRIGVAPLDAELVADDLQPLRVAVADRDDSRAVDIAPAMHLVDGEEAAADQRAATDRPSLSPPSPSASA